MRKFYVMLSMFAIVASTLLVSCAQPKEPDVVPAPPRTRTAEYTYSNSKGRHVWSYTTADTYSVANFKEGFWVHANDIPTSILRYTIDPNVAWTAEVEAASQEYIQFRVLKNGYPASNNIAEDYDPSYTVKGKRGSNIIYIDVIKTPAAGEEAVECNVNIIMAGESMPIAKLIIGPAHE